jgi:hypothetical protein
MLAALFLSLLACAILMRATNGQPSLHVTCTFRNVNATDVISAVAPISSLVAFNNYACMFMCTQDSDCVLVVFKFVNNNCNLYNLSALTRAVTSTDSIVYQKPNNA